MKADAIPSALLRPRHLLTHCCLLMLPWLANMITVQAQFSYALNSGAATITNYNGPGGAVVIPDTIDGYVVTGLAVPPKGVFSTSPITSLGIPNTVTNIGEWTFAGSSFLTSITIPDSVVSVGRGAFQNCASLGSIWLGSNVMTLGNEVFLNCSNLAEIAVSGFSPYYTGVGGVLFNKSATTLVSFPPGKGGDYAVPEGVTSIGDYAFETCRKLTNATFPDGVTSVGDLAFAYCSSVTNLVFPEGLTSLGAEAFLDCTSLAEIALPDTVTDIGSRGFQSCSSLGRLTLPDGLGSLATYLFIGCYGLTNLDFGAGVTNISYGAFEGCTGLTPLRLPRTLRHISFGAFSRTGTSSVIVPDTVASLGDWAFERAPALQRILFEGNAPALGANVFYGSSATIYYLPGTTGWSSTFAGLPAVLWNPHILTDTSSFGIGVDGFGFTIAGNADLPIGIEAADNLAEPRWTLRQTGILTNGSMDFSDPNWMNQGSRFYRITLP